MKDIKTLIYSIITSDATFLTLTGGSASDKRFYFQFYPDQVTTTNPWCTYYTITGSITGAEIGDIQVPDILLVIDIWGLEPDDIEDVFNRLKALLDRQELDATDHRVVHTRFEAYNDLAEDQPDMETLYHKNCRFRLGWVLEK